jgi:SagB-type dehydrogenase family enzyme
MKEQKMLKLSQPKLRSSTSVEEALTLRRTVRDFSAKEIGLSVISQLLWALQGNTRVESISRTEKVFHKGAPSAGKSYPLRVYLAFSKGVARYEPRDHALHVLGEKDVRARLSDAANAPANREAIKTAPVTIVLAADNERALKTTPIMESAVRFVHLEAGHAAQNLMLQAVSLGIGVCSVTSFDIAKIYKVLKLPLKHRPIYLLPLGFPREEATAPTD